ncbi:galactose-3-O-sulfotransferase 3-like [Watersipora subatra]|uniref:galactose-3-O-sulfotransferase 3-like n=1 Tax=Watersipora subatra TaxID=2589382 RepID=UPI00355B23C1
MMMSTNKGSLVNTREMSPGKSWRIGPDSEHPNLMEQHARYSHRFYQKHFPNNTVYITSIRDPVKWFISFVDFMKAYRGVNPRQVLEEDVLFYMERDHITGMQRQVHNNFLQWLGFDVYKSSIRKEVDEYIHFIDSHFLLVMITEYFDESLVLLKRLMNWSMADIFYTYANEAVKKSGTVLTSDEKRKLLDKDHNLGDWLLYQHFNKSFWEKISKQEEFHEEVAVFKKLQVKVHDFCFSEELKENKDIKLEIVTQWERNTVQWLFVDTDCLAIRVRNGKAEEFSKALDRYCPFRYQAKQGRRKGQRWKSKH